MTVVENRPDVEDEQTRPLPDCVETERALLGAMLLNEQAIADAAPIVTASDFRRPRHQVIFDAVATLHAKGDPVDAVTVADALGQRVDTAGGRGYLTELQGAPAAIGSAARYARTVAETAALRRCIVELSSVVEGAYTASDPAVVLERASEAIAAVRLPSVEPDRVYGFSELMGMDVARVRRPWVVPGVLRRRWRAIVVAEEGGGKSTMFRQVAVAVSRGVHPFTGGQVGEAQRTLIVDLENPLEVIHSGGRRLADLAAPAVDESGAEVESCWIMHREEGLYLRDRTARAELEAVLAELQPALVCLGPLYKAHYSEKGESSDKAAEATLAVLDDLRVRHDCALLLEHHAPFSPSGTPRELRPFGSQRWSAWPEFGVTLAPVRDQANTVKVGRFRRPRISSGEARWPSRLTVGQAHQWPFVGAYDDLANDRKGQALAVGTGRTQEERA